MGKQIPFSVLDEGFSSDIEKRNSLTFIMYKDVYDRKEKENDGFIIYPETIRLMYSSKIAESKKQIEGESSYYMKVLIKCNAPYVLLPKVRGIHNGLLHTLILGFDIINDNDNDFTYRVESEHDTKFKKLMKEVGRERDSDAYRRIDKMLALGMVLSEKVGYGFKEHGYKFENIYES
ncbi:MAG: hypothetical protein ACYSTS_05665 [Planctomycetota bacterium]|jgi:hypothetical protein